MKTITVRMDEAALAAVDRVRGSVPRERWIRERCSDAVAAQDAVRPDERLRDLAVGPPALGDEAGNAVDPASVTHVRVEAGSAVAEPWHVRASRDRERDIAAQKGGG